MKLIRLKITNIASIPEAEINFDAAPLNTTDVFLISGDVGAGKSTILDCVCLALYGATPRIAPAKDGGEISDINTLLRRGTGYSEVELEFTGNDGVTYLSTWSRQRARRKPQGKWQPVQWRLSIGGPGSPEERVLTKLAEVAAQIRQAVGLDYQDFCRTTLLAQGKFAAFIKGSDDNKAQILEKLTHTNYYTTISRKIHERASAAAAAVKDGEAEINAIVTLTDEESDTIGAEIERRNLRLAEIAMRESALTAMKTWLDKDAELRQKCADADSELRAATEACNAPEAAARRADLAAWDLTADARANAAGAEDFERKSAATSLKINEVGSRVGDLRALLGAMENRSLTLTGKVAKLDARLGELEPMAAQLDAADRIVSQIRANLKTAKQIANKSARLPQLDADVNAAAKPVADATDALERCKAELEAITARIADLEADADYKALGDSNTRLEAILKRKTALNEAATELARLTKAEADTADADRELARARADIETLRAVRTELEPQCTAARAAAEAARSAFENANLSLSESVELLRSRLDVGCRCPVCLQDVTRPVPAADAILHNIVEPLATARDAAQSTFDSLNTRLLKADADIEAKTAAANKEGTRLAAQRRANADARKDLEVKCEALETAPDADALAATLTALAADEQELNRTIGKGKQVQQRIKEQNADRTKADKQREELAAKLTAATAKADEAKRLHSEAETEVKTLSTALAGARAEVEEQVGDMTFPGVESPHSEAFAKALEALSAERAAATKDAEAHRREIEELTRRSGELAEVLAGLKDDNPEWFAAEVAPAQSVDLELFDRARELHLHYTGLRASLRDSRAEAAKLRRAVEEFLERETMPAEEFARLCAMTREAIAEMRRAVADADTRLTSAKSAVKTLAAESEAHAAQRSADLADETTAAELDTEIATLKEENSRLAEERGALRQKLVDNKTNSDRKAELIAALQTKLDEKERWAKLDALFGAADGKKFRSIAQSYVLENLIENANRYMAQLMPRYTLSGTPGTYEINVEDSYDGFAARPANHISGGETFVVSLALALSLADIGTSLAVDTLFIDEGFGNLSGEPLEAAIETLRTLRNRGGRRVGIISHITGLRESIPVQIRVTRHSNTNSSTVSVLP